MNVFDMRWSSRVEKLFAHGLLYTPSPGHEILALSEFDAMTLPPANAAVSSACAFAGSALDRRIAIRARSELESLIHFVTSPL